MNQPLPAARALVIHNDHILIIRRTKPGRKYMVTPGGRIEPGEDNIDALMREMAEETMVTVENPRLVFIEEPNGDTWGRQYIYLCDYVSGEPQLHPDSEELLYQAQGYGTYEPMWFPVSEFPSSEYAFLSPRLGKAIAEGIARGFPDEPQTWVSDRPA